MNIDSASSRPQREGGYRDAVLRLQAAQKPSAGTPLYSRLVNRPLGRRFAALAYLAGLKPNQVTGISAFFTFSGLALIAVVPPHWWLGVAVSAMLILGYAFDAADGQLARLRGGGSTQGEWLDHTVDAVKVCAVHLAVLIAAYRFFGVAELWLLVPLLYALVDTAMFSGQILKDLLAARFSGGKRPASTASTGVLRAIMVLPTDYGLMCLVLLSLGFPTVFFSIYTLLFACNAIILVLVLVKWYRDMGSLPA
ncbi:CDP-alcohol phosphatidyltransferase family protein [Tessaracoccus caeni]|uniref:CDP-alcohol phosphatidyltransferase family protein n=1 Tax=Tessaracoccus caeni TaxID=3031239 RepID=UPI0023DB8562|nr:CDP-alcohol phosphatidyltransferase family protein [Tessaracoccus caeni]MDF1487567.1 CDP-alcohol phosphatidyltransferase family protein [Tessaracoccus caeni]